MRKNNLMNNDTCHPHYIVMSSRHHYACKEMRLECMKCNLSGYFFPTSNVCIKITLRKKKAFVFVSTNEKLFTINKQIQAKKRMKDPISDIIGL